MEAATITAAEWTDEERNVVRVTLSDGRVFYVPKDESNADWQLLQASDFPIANPPPSPE